MFCSLKQLHTPASTLVISNTLIPAKGSFSIVALSTAFRVAILLFQTWDLCAGNRPLEARQLERDATRRNAPKLFMILLLERHFSRSCHVKRKKRSLLEILAPHPRRVGSAGGSSTACTDSCLATARGDSNHIHCLILDIERNVCK